MSDAHEREKSVSEAEEEILKFWEKNRIFEKTLQKIKGKKPFVFYEGPPTANAAPGLHHVEARTFKDIIPRYKTMRGFFVERKAGWDTHGLPVELQVEKALGLKSKKDIEAYGVARFNEACRASVWQFKQEWERLTKRIGFWLDLERPYITYETSYIETLWWIIKEFWKKKLLYQDFKVLPWCPRCQTGLSSHELGLGYKKIKDTAVYVKFRLKPGQKIGDFTTDDKTYVLAWTTTPWTLPGNVALAAGSDISYSLVSAENGEKYIFARARAKALGKAQFFSEAILNIEGKELEGLSYDPLFEISEIVAHKKAHHMYCADFVSVSEGTGVVHTAVMYGEDDYTLGKKIGLPTVHTVDEAGYFTKDVSEGLAGLAVKDRATEEKIIASLESHGLLFAKEQYEHEYPHCWRCDTPLLYYARQGWWVKMSQLKKELWKNNETINWIPEHIKHGRFGEFIKDVRDWAFSRERFWGTPLPIWECSSCKTIEVAGSLEELIKKHPHGNNRYILMRHGQALSNVRRVLSSIPEGSEKYPLTDKGKKQAEAAARKLKKRHIDFVYASPLRRTRETAEIVCGILGISEFQKDARLSEIKMGDFEGKSPDEYHSYAAFPERFATPPPGKKELSESLGDVRARAVSFLDEMERLHSGKTILVISHEHPLWLMHGGALGLSNVETLALRGGKRKNDFLKNGEIIEVRHRVLPRDERGLVNLHRPYVDEYTFLCGSCGETMKRVREVADVWFDSGAMPFAQHHFPFAFAKEKKPTANSQQPTALPYPADYISEAIDQTRGWFYTLLATATALGKKAPYKNVISLGHVLDKNGQKMSKSRGNIVNPWDVIEKYGADALRWYFVGVNAPGDPKLFDERDVALRGRGALATFWNSFLFFDTYVSSFPSSPSSEAELLQRTGKFQVSSSRHILDQWILARLNDVTREVTKKLDEYTIVDAARALDSFIVEDFSNWYLRRSRRRFQKAESKKELQEAAGTLAFALLRLAELAAPFVPFAAERVYQGLRQKMKLRPESVHLNSWPVTQKKTAPQKKLLDMMQTVRGICAEALRQRANAKIKVRQPLGMLQIANSKSRIAGEFLDIIKEEVNVKDITFGKETKLNTALTEELREEGFVRELVRRVQDMRRGAGLAPRDAIDIQISGDPRLQNIMIRWEEVIRKETRARRVMPHSFAARKSGQALEREGARMGVFIKKIRNP